MCTHITFQVITHTCNAGSTITVGNAKRTCLRNGQLTGTAPTCTGNKLTQFKYEKQITLSCKLVDIKLLITVYLLVTPLSKYIQSMLCTLEYVNRS